MARKKKGRCAKKAQAARSKFYEPEYLSKAPHSFIVSRGAVGRNVQELMMDMRQVMAPYTANRLKVRRKNVLKDFVSVAGPLGVTHLMVFSQPGDSINMKLVKLPRGPTLCFKMSQYSLMRDIVSTLKRPATFAKQFEHHPLLVMNGFTNSVQHEKLVTTMFQNMYPTINVNKVKLSKMRRCVLVNYEKDRDVIQFRHYNIKVVPQGIGRGVKKLVKNKVPNLAKFTDVSDFVLRGGGNLSESEAEMDGAHNEVTLAQDMSSRGNIKSNQAAIRLTEIGPRLELQLYKIQDGCSQGNTLYHRYISMTDAEVKAKKRAYEKKKQLKQARREQQEVNVERKRAEREGHRQKSLAGIKRKHAETVAATGKSDGDGDNETEEVDDDAAWYRQEVGEEPDQDMINTGAAAAAHKLGRRHKRVRRGGEKIDSKTRNATAKQEAHWKQQKTSQQRRKTTSKQQGKVNSKQHSRMNSKQKQAATRGDQRKPLQAKRNVKKTAHTKKANMRRKR